MNLMAALLVCAAGFLAQDGTTAEQALTDAELGVLGGYAAEQIDATSDSAALEKSILTKIEDIRKARSEKKNDSASPKGKGKRKKAAKKPAAAPSDTIKNGLTDADRRALGKFVVSGIANGTKGEEFSAALKKELERLRAERVKSSSTGSAGQPKKKRKKAEKS